jgi:type III secretory pathway lipoprotein EscJ
MKSRLTVLILFVLLLTGCAHNEDLTRDKSNDLITIMWQACLNHYIGVNKDRIQYTITDDGSQQITLDAAKACFDLKPITE